MARLPVSIAGAPTVTLPDDALTAQDDDGPLPLVAVTVVDDDEPVREWRVERASTGTVEVTHRAEPIDAGPAPATPPLELRREGPGLSGALKCFVALPAGPEDVEFEVTIEHPTGWLVATSLGEDSTLTAAGWSCSATPTSSPAPWATCIGATAPSPSGG